MSQQRVRHIKQVLLFEFITGGGFSQQDLPKSLAKEGLIMLKALVRDIALCPHIQLTVVLDWRIKAEFFPQNTKLYVIKNNQSVYDVLPALIEQSDCVWPIAPEIDEALLKITKLIEQNKKRLLNSSIAAVYLCSDKLLTTQLLNRAGIETVDSVQLDQFTQQFPAPWVVKAKEGAGCVDSHYVLDGEQLLRFMNKITSPQGYVIQPYIEGSSLSLSCLFNKGKASLLCCNKQEVSISDGGFELEACVVNVIVKNEQLYQILIDKIAAAIPELSAYVGVDIMQPVAAAPLVLEINPRLTTSYVGIQQAIGFNVAKAVIEMSETAPIIKKTRNEQVIVAISDNN